MTRIAHAGLGFWIALVVPLHLQGRRLAALLAPWSPESSAVGDPDRVMVAFRWALRRLSKLPPWRYTCLYRAAGECLILRRCGHPASLRLGVRREGASEGEIAAHAWVHRPSGTLDVSASRYELLHPASTQG